MISHNHGPSTVVNDSKRPGSRQARGHIPARPHIDILPERAVDAIRSDMQVPFFLSGVINMDRSILMKYCSL